MSSSYSMFLRDVMWAYRSCIYYTIMSYIILYVYLYVDLLLKYDATICDRSQFHSILLYSTDVGNRNARDKEKVVERLRTCKKVPRKVLTPILFYLQIIEIYTNTQISARLEILLPNGNINNENIPWTISSKTRYRVPNCFYTISRYT